MACVRRRPIFVDGRGHRPVFGNRQRPRQRLGSGGDEGRRSRSHHTAVGHQYCLGGVDHRRVRRAAGVGVINIRRVKWRVKGRVAGCHPPRGVRVVGVGVARALEDLRAFYVR